MKIAIFTPNKNPYSETFIQAHKAFLKQEVFYYYGVGSKIILENHPPLVSTPKRIWLKAIQILCKKPVNYIWVEGVLKSLKQNKIEVILVEYGTHSQRLLPLLDKAQIPYAVHFHGYDASVRALKEKLNNYREVFQKASKIFAVSTIMKKMLIEIDCPEHKLVYNVYGPQPHFAQVEPRFSKEQFIAIGRFTDKKAPYYTILAFSKVLNDFPNAQLIMAGDGALINTCINLIKYLKIEGNVQLVGVISAETYASYLAESLAFVQHSITAANGDMEGTPLAVLEASSAGLPVISTYHAGISDVIRHQKTGLLSYEHDVDTMANHMLKVLNDKAYAKKLGDTGKHNIATNYSLERHISVLQHELEQIKE